MYMYENTYCYNVIMYVHGPLIWQTHTQMGHEENYTTE